MKASAFLIAALAGTAAIAQTAPLASGITKSYIDTAAKPGNGFNQYANGKWTATAEIPADRTSTGIALDVQNVAEKRNAEIIESARGSKIAAYYAAFIDTAGIEARGLAPLKAQLAAIDAIDSKGKLSAALGVAMRADTDVFNNTKLVTENLFGVFVSQDLNRPAVTIPYVMQGGIGLPDRDYYLSDKPAMQEIRAAYLAYAAKQFANAGLSDPQGRATRLIALETRIAQAHWNITDTQDAHKGDNPWKRADFSTRAPGIDWEAYWAAAGLAKQQEFIAWQPSAITKLSALVASEPLATWKDFLALRLIMGEASVLPKAFDDAHFDMFSKTLTGAQAPRPRDKRAIASVNANLGDAVGQIYAQRYFPASSRAEIQQMVKNIVAAFDARLVQLDWLAPATKAEARRKLAVLRVGVGYGDKWRDYAGLVIKADDPVGNLQRAKLYEYRHQIAKIGKPVDRDEWWMTPQTVNAVNLPLQNALNFPAAILETPYFDPKFDAAANYGSIGATIGHEISHSFDNLGSDFDSTGKLRSWWTKADFTRFDAAGKALADQYDAYEALPGLHLDGQQELGENIADTAGLTAAYEAYHASLGGQPAPVIDGLTGDQRFFLAFAQSWRSKMRDRALRSRIATDVHAPAMWRVETVRNLDAWYAAFGIKPGDAMYLSPERRVHVW